MKAYIRNFNEVGLADVAAIGEKNAYLAELYNKTTTVPKGFVLTVAGYNDYIAANSLQDELDTILSSLDTTDYTNLKEIGLKARTLIMHGKFPIRLENAVGEAYKKIFDTEDQEVAVRCSLEKDHTEAGESIYETHLNVKGSFALIYAIKCCFAFIYSDNAIKYRQSSGQAHNNISLSIGVQKMVRSDLACSGIAVATSNPDGTKSITISGVWGLGSDAAEAIAPDEYTLIQAADGKTTLTKKKGNKSGMLVYKDPAAGINTTTLKITPPELRDKFTLDDSEVRELAKLVQSAQDLFDKPMIVKWAKDGLENTLHLVGVKNITLLN